MDTPATMLYTDCMTTDAFDTAERDVLLALLALLALLSAPHTFDTLIALARWIARKSQAEFDYELAFGAQRGNWSAYTAFEMAAAALASHRHLTAHGAAGDPGWDAYVTYREQLLTQHRGELAEMAAKARAKSYTGWSHASGGPIEYAGDNSR